MLQQFTNLSNALSPATAKHPVVHRLAVVSLSIDTIRTPLWPLLTLPQNLPCKITKVHTSPLGIRRYVSGTEPTNMISSLIQGHAERRTGMHNNVQRLPGSCCHRRPDRRYHTG